MPDTTARNCYLRLCGGTLPGGESRDRDVAPHHNHDCDYHYFDHDYDHHYFDHDHDPHDNDHQSNHHDHHDDSQEAEPVVAKRGKRCGGRTATVRYRGLSFSTPRADRESHENDDDLGGAPQISTGSRTERAVPNGEHWRRRNL